MIRPLLAAAALGTTLAAVAADRLLARRRGTEDPPPIDTLAVVDAPIDRTWEVVADVPRQPEWMHDLKSVRMSTPEPTREGSRGEGTVRILGIAVTDPVTVTAFEPPTRFAVRHEGAFAGGGLITLEAGADGTTTIVRWSETLRPPVLPHLASLLLAPVLRAVFQADLLRLKALVEAAPTDGRTSAAPAPAPAPA